MLRIGQVLDLKAGKFTILAIGAMSTDAKFWGRFTVLLIDADGNRFIAGGKNARIAWNARVSPEKT